MNNVVGSAISIKKRPNPVPAEERTRPLENPAFDRIFTDHMVIIRYIEGRGWYGVKIGAHDPIQCDLSTLVLYYAQEIFESMKAYRLSDGGGALSRPEVNARRFQNSAKRPAVPALPEDLLLQVVRELVKLDCDWISSGRGSTPYLRPFMTATEVVLGVKPSAEYLFCMIACPVGAYFKGDASSGVIIWVSDNYTRVAPGGTGEARCGGSYAASLVAQTETTREDCDQVIFLDAVERKRIEELGGMSVFFVSDDGLLQTSPLTGTILPGITRDSLITLARGMGPTVRGEPYSIDQWQADAQSGRLCEAFACGTAAVVTPIGKVKGHKHNFTIGDGKTGELATKLKAVLVDPQNNRAPDPHGWFDRLF